jgi:hypothetical protein
MLALGIVQFEDAVGMLVCFGGKQHGFKGEIELPVGQAQSKKWSVKAICSTQ